MSLRSMTGYGRGTATASGLTVTVEISSVNRKQFDLSLSAPRSLTVLEAPVTEAVQKVISRGRVNVDLAVDWSEQARRRTVRVDTNVAKAYLKAVRAAAKELGVADDISMQSLLSVPDVLQVAQPKEQMEKVWRVTQRALRQALRQLSAMRQTEGKVLQADLQQRLQQLAEYATRIEGRAPHVAETYRAKLQARLEQARLQLDPGDDRLMREMVLFADRSDISEELTRLESHFQQARQMMRSRKATGRSLDFLAQEMFREINTIGSKANDAAILQDVVTFKTELERIREQVQNVE